MFTGIIEALGTVNSITLGEDSARIEISAPGILSDVSHGASISVNGVCLTVVEFSEKSFSADVMKETLDRSNFGGLAVKSRVNLERAMPISGRLGGHIVQGHVDSTGIIKSISPSSDWTVMKISLPGEISRYVIEKGSITVNGTSLTVASVSDPQEPQQYFTVSLIPTTLALTTLGQARIGEVVNLEVDALAKYVERIMAFSGFNAKEKLL